MRIRKDNDIKVLWTIERGGNPENMETATDVVLTLIQGYKTNCDTVENVIQPTSIVDNVLTVEIPKEQNNILGAMRLKLEYTIADPEMADGDRKTTVDKLIAVIVESTELADTTGEFAVTSDAAIGFEGRSAYEVWLIENPDKTLEDYFDWLQQPATDIAEDVSQAEVLRVQAEEARIDAEDTRVSNEQTRVTNESERVTAEQDRVDAEIIREQQEANRQTNTSTAISNAEEATINANNAAEAAEEAAVHKGYFTSTTALNTAYPSPTDGQVAYVADIASSTGFYIYNAVGGAWVSSTVEAPAVEAPLSEYTLNGGSTKTAAQLDSDIAQLEGDVNDIKVKDAEQGASIKEIENLLSTSNLNQTAKVSSTGREIVSLPKTASNGGMDVKLEGLTATNLVNGKAVAAGASVTFQTILGNKYYVSNAADIVTGDGNIYTATNSGASAIDIIAVNLTPTFASGSEPNFATSKLIFSTYFAGTKSFVPTGRVRSVGKNLYKLPSDGSRKSVDGEDAWLTRSHVIMDKGFMPNTRYFMGLRSRYVGYGGRFQVEYTDGTSEAGTFNGAAFINVAFSTATGKTVKKIIWSQATDNYGTYIAINSQYLYAEKIATPYEPYRSTNLYLTAPELRSNGTVKDEIRKGANGYEMVQRINPADGTVLATPLITPISHAGILNSAESGTVYHEPIVADAGIYSTKIDILQTEFPISEIEEVIKHEDGINTYLDASKAVIAPDGLSFTHPDLVSGDLVLFTYAFNKESTNGLITATFYDSRYVIADTNNGKHYKWGVKSTNGVATIQLTEV